MCYGCYEEFGKPEIVNDKTIAAAKLIDGIYEFHLAGGNAHIVVDDWNLDDDSIKWCLEEGMRENYCEASPEQIEVERRCLLTLLSMSDDERASAMAIHDGFIGVK